MGKKAGTENRTVQQRQTDVQRDCNQEGPGIEETGIQMRWPQTIVAVKTGYRGHQSGAEAGTLQMRGRTVKEKRVPGGSAGDPGCSNWNHFGGSTF